MVSSTADKPREIVVLVHGLYMHGLAMLPLSHWMRACGFLTRQFSYPALTRSVPDNATRLADFLRTIDTPTVHFLCHSLGGLVVRAMMLQCNWQRPGRVLTLGTPHLGSYVARRLGAHRALAWAVGRSLRHGLDGDLPPWPKDREVATIAGIRSIGAGRIVAGLPRPNDGVVALAETDLGPQFQRVVLPEAHSSMLISRRVARYACAYMKTGVFPDSDTAL